MQEDTAAWPQPMWGLFRLGRDGPVRGDHGRKGGTAWISAPGKTWATNRNHAARAIPNSASPPPSHATAAGIQGERNVSGIPPAAPQRTMILRRPSRAKSPLCPLTRCPASPTGIPGQVLHPPFTHGGVENRVSEGYGQRSRSHPRGRTVVECRSSPAPWSRDTLIKSLNASAFTPSFLRKQEPETLWIEVPACAGRTGRDKHPGHRLMKGGLLYGAAWGGVDASPIGGESAGIVHRAAGEVVG